MALGRILEGFVTILVGLNLVPAVGDQVFLATHTHNGTEFLNTNNFSGAGVTILNLVTLFFVLGIMIAGVQIAVGGLADIGLI